MSWSSSIELGPDDHLPVEGQAEVLAGKLAEKCSPPATTDEVKDHLVAAGKVAVDLLGVVGDGPYVIVANGHANPDHKPTPGWSNDTISVSVRSNAPLPKADE